MGTNIQEVFDSFFVKIPSVNFSGQETLVFQLFKSSIPYCYKTVPEDLTYTYDSEIHKGVFKNTLGQDTIELIALVMRREYYKRLVDKYAVTKQYIGTSAFNKLPNVKEMAESARTNYKIATDDFEKFKNEFYTYKN